MQGIPETLWPHGLQHTRFPGPSPTPGTYSNSCPSSRWCHPTISSSAFCFSSCLQSFPASGSFPMSPFFTSGCQSIGVSPSVLVLQMNIQDKLWKGLKEMGILDHLTSLMRNLMWVQRQQLERWMELIVSRWRKEYHKTVCCHPVCLTYTLSTSWKMPGWMSHKLESR